MKTAKAAPAPNRRLWMLAAILALWLLTICLRLIQLEIFQYGDYVQRAQRQQQRSIEVDPQRGVIYDRNGHELAMSMAVDSIFAVPSEVPDQNSAATMLAKVLDLEPQEVLTRMKSSRAFCWIARKVEQEKADRVRALNLKGIYFQKESKRFYPKGELAAQVLGYVGLDDEGLGGVERSYEGRLRGKPGRMIISMDARRRWFGRVERQPETGEDLVLTIEEKIQYLIERELDAAMAQSHALAGTIIVQNPKTGEILALANRPSFNPNQFSRSAARAMKDPAVSDIYEPGSTFKVVTLAAALEEKITHPEEVVDCQMGSIEIAGRTIHDHKPFGALTVAQILANSSDVGAIKIALRLGEDRFDDYIRAFGFGRQTGIELPGETRGITKPISRWSKTSIAAISMGQEIGVSPVQLVSMMSTIANDGVYNAPRVVAGTLQGATRETLRQVAFQPDEQRRVISTLTAAEMKKMLEGVVLFGTGKRALLEGYTSAGKTGTAQKADPATGTYSKTQYIASFAGFAPVNNPEVTIAVILDSPQGSHEGGIVAAPVFARVGQEVLAYMNVPRDAALSDSRRLLLRAAAHAPDSDIADSANDRLGDAFVAADTSAETLAASEAAEPHKKTLPAATLKPAALITAKPVAGGALAMVLPALATPAGAPSHAQGGTVVVDVGGGVPVPSLLGMPVREALEVAEQSGFELDIVGSGVAQEQVPAAGVHLAPGGRVTVKFAR